MTALTKRMAKPIIYMTETLAAVRVHSGLAICDLNIVNVPRKIIPEYRLCILDADKERSFAFRTFVIQTWLGGYT